MASVFRRGRKWYFAFTDENGRRVSRKGCTDKRETERLANAADERVAKIREGVLDPAALERQKQAARPIREHIEAFIARLEVAASSPQHVAQTRKYIGTVCELGQVKRLTELTNERVAEAVAILKSRQFAARTIAADVTSMRRGRFWSEPVACWRDSAIGG